MGLRRRNFEVENNLSVTFQRKLGGSHDCPALEGITRPCHKKKAWGYKDAKAGLLIAPQTLTV